MDKINLPSGVQTIIEKLEQSGHEAYVVGGCVRDSLMGVTPHDWDICTSAVPEEVKECFTGYPIYDTGLKHGTVTIMARDGQLYEVTTFRIDGAYSDNRRPDSVAFVKNVKKDLMRRDFTMNAIAYNDRAGFVDPYGGREAIRNKVIACVGNPSERFIEDGLRIMRALRFSSVLGFEIEPETARAIHEYLDLLPHIARERIKSELVKLLLGKNVLNILLDYSDVITNIIPELAPCVGFEQNNKYHKYNVYDHIAHAVANYTGDDPLTKVALLLHDIGKPHVYSEDEKGGHFYMHASASHYLAEQVLSRLRFSNMEQHDIAELVLFHDTLIAPTPKTIRRWLHKLGESQVRRLMDIRLADIMAHADGTQDSRIEQRNDVVKLIDQELARDACFSLKNLHINGNDIMSLGVQEGREVGEYLDMALNAVIDGDVDNDHCALITFVLEQISYKEA